MRILLLPGLLLALTSAACSDDVTSPGPSGSGTGPGGSVGVSGSSSGAGTGGSAGSSGADTGGGGTSSGTAGAAGTGGVAGGGSGGTAGTGGGGTGGSGGVENLMPTKLSETGLYADITTKTLATGVYPFSPTYALWSDGAAKERWVYMPPGGKIQTDANNRGMEFWQYPKGFKLWKQFSRDGKIIETRLLQKRGDGVGNWFMVAFQWNDTHTDAVAVPDGVMNAMDTMHDIPTQKACGDCHGSMYDNALGFSAVQLSHDDAADHMTLAKAVELGWFNIPPPATGYKLPGTEVEQKALGYLHANCGMCHNSFSNLFSAKTSMDLWTRVDMLANGVPGTAAYLSLLCDQWPSAKTINAAPPVTMCEAGHATGAPMDLAGDIGKPKRVAPHDAANSGIHFLMSQRIAGAASNQMPPLGTELADTDGGMKDIAAWITGLP